MSEIYKGARCEMKVETDRLSEGQLVTFVRLDHFCGGTSIVLQIDGRRAYERVALMPGKTINDYIANIF